MKLIYLTSQRFPSKKAEPVYHRQMARALTKLLGKNFLFLVRGNIPDELKNINTVSIKLPKYFRVFFYFLRMPFLIMSQKWNNYETIFFSYDPYLLSIIIFWRKFFRFKYSICSDWHQLFNDWRDKYVAKRSDYLISTSKRLKGILSFVCGIDRNKILVAYGGIDADFFVEKLKINRVEYKKRLKLPTNTFLVGYIGGFRSVGMEKGLGTMIKAIPYLNEKINMVFVGGSKQYINEYIKLAESKKVENRCIFVKKQPFEKVAEYEIAMDILVIPYPNKRHFRDYGFPMKVWEYLASGRPIVYSDLDIIAEALDGRGVSFQPDDARSLAHSILSIFNDVESAEKIARENPSVVRSYTWKSRAENIINFIRK